MDDDTTNEVSLDEFTNWLNHRPQRRLIARSLSLNRERQPSQTPLTEVNWTSSTLHAELQAMLLHSQVSALDLVLAYDKSEDGTLSKREYLAMMKALIGEEAAWRGGAKDAALDIFEQIAGDDNELDIEEMVRWIPQSTRYVPPVPPAPQPLSHSKSTLAGKATPRRANRWRLISMLRLVKPSAPALWRSSRVQPGTKYTMPAESQNQPKESDSSG